MPRIALAQINVTVGALKENAARIRAAQAEALRFAPDLVVYPELTLAGYPPEDLLLKPGFLAACEAEFAALVADLPGRALIGYPSSQNGGPHNSAAVVEDGQVRALYHKVLLPNYSVFDEKRYFKAGTEGLILDLAGQKLGVIVCEDAWEDGGPARDEAAAGATAILNLSASPFQRGKHRLREETFARLCRQNEVYFLYCNLLGGQDELVFDGASLVMDPAGRILARGAEFAEDLLVFDLPPAPPRAPRQLPDLRPVRTCMLTPSAKAALPAVPPRPVEKLSPVAEIHDALVLGIRDYVRKNGFSGVIIGLSGGIDSALTAALAAAALGPQNVLGVSLPSRYSSADTRSDAERVARNLGIGFAEIPIGEVHNFLSGQLAPHFVGASGDPENLTDQNLQARLRGVILMALSNKFGRLVLNTSNKSEVAVGYGTLYGDMVGGYAAIRDVFKTQVWELARFVNQRAGREAIPVSTIERVPTAELRPDQEDRQSIPDYPVLDPILELYVEQDLCQPDIIARGHDPEIVRKVAGLVDRAEFKRRQAVMGPRVTPKAFGKDRRLPVTNRFR